MTAAHNVRCTQKRMPIAPYDSTSCSCLIRKFASYQEQILVDNRSVLGEDDAHETVVGHAFNFTALCCCTAGPCLVSALCLKVSPRVQFHIISQCDYVIKISFAPCLSRSLLKVRRYK